MQRDVEIGWTVGTLFTFLFVFWWMASAQLNALAQPKTNFEIYIEAKQWMWKVEQPNGAREIDEIHVPAHTDVRLIMTSDDVIHSFFCLPCVSSATCCRTATPISGSKRSGRGLTISCAPSSAAPITRA